MPVGVAYRSDLERVRAILAGAAEMNAKVLSYPEPLIPFVGLGGSSLRFELRCCLRDMADTLTVRSELLTYICDALGRAGVEIPSRRRALHLRDLERFVDAVRPAPRHAAE